MYVGIPIMLSRTRKSNNYIVSAYTTLTSVESDEHATIVRTVRCGVACRTSGKVERSWLLNADLETLLFSTSFHSTHM